MFVFLEAMRKPEEQEQAQQNVQQARLTPYEQSGISLISQLNTILKDVSTQPISSEFSGNTRMPDATGLSNFNSYSSTSYDGAKTITVVEIKNPDYVEAVAREEGYFNNLSPQRQDVIIRNINEGRSATNNVEANLRLPDQKDVNSWIEAKKDLDNTPKEIYIIKDEQTGKTTVTSIKPTHFSSKGEQLYAEYNMDGSIKHFNKYDRTKTEEPTKLSKGFKPDKVSGEPFAQFTLVEFNKKCNLTTDAKKAAGGEYEQVSGTNIYVKKSAQLEDKVQPEGIMP